MVSTTETPLEVREVAPGGLIIAANVRTDTQVDKTFVSSIKQHGVLVPIIVEEVDGELRVKDGQRRAIAAIEAGLATVPVVVGASGTEAERIIEQLVVNDQRAELTDAEHTGAFGALTLLGISADSIARKTNTPKKRVELAVNVTQSEVASKAMVEHQLDLDQAATVLEFEDDPADVEQLVDAVGAGQFDHVASQIRVRRQTDRLYDQLVTAYTNDGVKIWTEDVCSYEDVKGAARKLDYLYATEKAASSYGSTLKAKDHAECPHRAVVIDTGLEWNGNAREPYARAIEVCTDWRSAGHFERSSSSSGRPAAGTPEADAASAQRRLTIANNKLWMPSTEVRLTFIKELLQRKEAPSDWERVVARHYAAAYQPGEHREQVKTLLGIGSESIETWLKTNPTKAPQLLVGMVFSFAENSQDFAKSGWRSSRAKAHLQQLSTWGYTLSDIEERVLQGTANQVAT